MKKIINETIVHLGYTRNSHIYFNHQIAPYEKFIWLDKAVE